MSRPQSDLSLLAPDASNGVLHLFRPFVTESMKEAVWNQMSSRWVGQGPKVDEFESRFENLVLQGEARAVATNSATAGLHLASILALQRTEPPSSKDRGEVVAPIFTCTATNYPWLYEGLQIRWADVEPGSLNVSVASIARQMTKRTRAISVVHYGGLSVDMDGVREVADAWGVPVIEDAAQALGGRYKGKPIGTLSEFTVFSFQAIKHITTGDGGMLAVPDSKVADEAKRRRWFGIDRKAKQSGIWENDISELGYKYQLTDIAASMGLVGLENLDHVLHKRRQLFGLYVDLLQDFPRVEVVGAKSFLENPEDHAAWLVTVIVDRDLDSLRQKLRDNLIESNPVHYRNDRYSVFGSSASGDAPVMDSIEGRYLCLPIHMSMELEDVRRVCALIKEGW